MIRRSIWLICLCSSFGGYSQNTGSGYLLTGIFIRHAFQSEHGKKRSSSSARLDYSLSPNTLILINWVHDGRISSIDLGQSLRYQYSFSRKERFRLSGLFQHTLGFQYFFDSIARVNTDDNSISLKLDLTLRHHLSLTLNSLFSTRLMNGYDYRVSDSGSLVRTLNSSFLTPAVLTLSCGLGFGFRNFGTLSFGISSLRLTYIMNRAVFSRGDISSFYGIEKGENTLLEYGVLLQMLIEKDIVKKIHWDCDFRMFRNYRSSPVDISLKNIFGYKFNRFIKVNLQTRILYEERISRHLQVENLFSVGFYFQM